MRLTRVVIHRVFVFQVEVNFEIVVYELKENARETYGSKSG